MKDLDVPASLDSCEWIDCFYINATRTIQIIRIASIASWHLERVVLPGMHLLFKAPAEAIIDVYNGEMATGLLADRVPCSQLACSQGDLVGV